MPPLGDELRLRALGDGLGEPQRDGDRDERDHRQQRRDQEHHDQDAEDRQQRDEQLAHGLLQGLGDVVDVVGDAGEHLAALLAVEVAQRQPVELVLDLAAQHEHGALDDAVEQVALDVPEDGRGQVDQDDGEQHEAEGVEVDPGAGDDVLRLDDVGDGAVALGARRGCGLLGGEPGRQLAADHAGEDQVGGVAEDLGADDVERHADHAERDDDGDAEPVRHEQPGEPFGRRPEVRRLLGGHAGADPGRAVAAPGVGHAAGGLAGLGVLLGLAAGGARGRGGGGHAAASADSCDSTISTNVGQVCSNSSWVPLPTITPSSRTRIWSASAIVDTRWATMTTVA